MKLKDLFSETKNKKNKQINFALRQKELKKLGLSKSKLMEIKIDKLYQK